MHKPKPALFLIIFATLISAPLFTQTAQKVENLLNEPAITWAAAAVFALEAANIETFSNPDDAFRYAMDRKWLPKNISADGKARLDGVALLLIEAFTIKSGFFYSMTKNPHYAYRELVYKQVIRGRTDPEMFVSGEQFLIIVNRILSIKEAGR